MRLRFCVLIATVLLLAAALTVPARAQEVITEEEFERRFKEDPATLYERCIAYETIVVVTDVSAGTWYAKLWKIVKAGGHMTHSATVTVTVPDDVDVKADWGDKWETGGSVTDRTFLGFAVIWFRWNTDDTRNEIEIKISVSKEGFPPTPEETITIYGNWKDNNDPFWCFYKCNCHINTLYPPPSAPEFTVETSVMLSLATAFYLMTKRKVQHK